MNSIKEKIVAFLKKTPEATAKQIAAGIGETEAMSSVNNALNALRTEAAVEGETKAGRGSGKELWYWLTAAAPAEPSKPRRAGFLRTQAGKEAPADKECCNAARVVATTAGSEVAELREKLATAERARDDHFSTIESLRVRIDALTREKAEALNRIADLECAIDMASKAEPSAYLVAAPKRKPRKLKDKDAARAAAESASKATGRRVKLLGLVELGTAIPRKARIVEFKEAA